MRASAKTRKQVEPTLLPPAVTSQELFREKLAKAEPVTSPTSKSSIAAERAALARMIDRRAGALEKIVFDHGAAPVRLTGRVPKSGAGPDEKYELEMFGTTGLDDQLDMISVSNRDGWVRVVFPTKVGHLNTIMLDVFLPGDTPFYWGCRVAPAGTKEYKFVGGNNQDKGSFVRASPNGRAVDFIVRPNLAGTAELLFWPRGLTSNWLLFACTIGTV